MTVYAITDTKQGRTGIAPGSSFRSSQITNPLFHFAVGPNKQAVCAALYL